MSSQHLLCCSIMLYEIIGCQGGADHEWLVGSAFVSQVRGSRQLRHKISQKLSFSHFSLFYMDLFTHPV